MGKMLLDCDGVMLDWLGGFRSYVTTRLGMVVQGDSPSDYGMVRWLGLRPENVRSLIIQFNQSPYFRQLEPMPGAVDAISEIRRHGHDITVISSCGRDFALARRENLRNVFGGDMGVLCLDLGESKFATLNQFEAPAIWVEDNANAAWQGTVFGFECFCFCRAYNKLERVDEAGVTWVSDWAPILAASERGRRHVA